MQNRFEDNTLSSINKKKLDKILIQFANKCIEYIVNSKINPLKNKNDGTPLSEADLKIDNIIRNCLNLFEKFTGGVLRKHPYHIISRRAISYHALR